jgi:hypothetical protein
LEEQVELEGVMGLSELNPKIFKAQFPWWGKEELVPRPEGMRIIFKTIIHMSKPLVTVNGDPTYQLEFVEEKVEFCCDTMEEQWGENIVLDDGEYGDHMPSAALHHVKWYGCDDCHDINKISYCPFCSKPISLEAGTVVERSIKKVVREVVGTEYEDTPVEKGTNESVTLSDDKVYHIDVCHFDNGMVAVFDVASGQQVPELQGRFAEKKEAIAQAVKDGRIVIEAEKQYEWGRK